MKLYLSPLPFDGCMGLGCDQMATLSLYEKEEGTPSKHLGVFCHACAWKRYKELTGEVKSDSAFHRVVPEGIL